MDWYRLLPLYWLQNYPTNREWDAFITAALDRGDVFAMGYAEANVGGVTVWVENWPYAFGRPHHARGFSGMLPSVRTRKRLRDALLVAEAKQLSRRTRK